MIKSLGGMEGTVEKTPSYKVGAFRAVRSANQRYVLQHSLSFKDIRHIAADLSDLVKRFNRVRSLGGKYREIEMSPYVGRMIKIIGAEKITENMIRKVS